MEPVEKEGNAGTTTGVAIIMKMDPTTPREFTKIEKGSSGRWLATTITREDKESTRIMVVYAPAGEKKSTELPRKEVTEAIHKWTKKQKDYMAATDKIIVLGDWNATFTGQK